MTVTDESADAQDTQWGYVLHQQGIEVISLLHEDIGPLVDWATDPRTAFSNHPAAWSSLAPAPAIRASRSTPPQSTCAASPAKCRTPPPATRR
ncbi:hypothetical protein [Streptomyces malaysiensis]